MNQATEMKKSHASPAWLEKWHVSPSNNPDYNLVDGLRGIAILLVLCCHFLYVNPKSGPFIQFLGGFFGAGSHGVPLFFCISGFLISLPFWFRKVRKSDSVVPRGYGWRRFWKIYPPLALSVVCLTPYYIATSKDWSYIGTALQWLSGLSFFVPPSGKLNPVMWSLVVEVQFYITIALVFLCLKRVSVRTSLWLVTCTLLTVPCILRFSIYDGTGPEFFPKINSHFPSGLDYFAFGILIAGLEATKSSSKRWAKLGNLGLFLLFFALLAAGWGTLHPLNQFTAELLHWDVILAAGLMLCYVADPDYAVSRWLCFAPLRWVGLISYELYLVHQPIILGARYFFGPCEGNILRYLALQVGAGGASILLAALMYKLFSLPILRRKRSIHASTLAIEPAKV